MRIQASRDHIVVQVVSKEEFARYFTEHDDWSNFADYQGLLLDAIKGRGLCFPMTMVVALTNEDYSEHFGTLLRAHLGADKAGADAYFEFLAVWKETCEARGRCVFDHLVERHARYWATYDSGVMEDYNEWKARKRERHDEGGDPGAPGFTPGPGIID